MKNKFKTIVTGLLVAITVTSTSPLTVMATADEYILCSGEESTGQITPRSDIIGWRYKVVDGVLYKRQYNYTRTCWIGEWERID